MRAIAGGGAIVEADGARRLTPRAVVLAVALVVAFPTLAQDACKNRGELDTPFCDENGDLLADTPKDPKKLKDTETLFFTNSPLDDGQSYNKAAFDKEKARAEAAKK